MNTEQVAPGPWLRAIALAAVAACLLTVVSGPFGPAFAHRLLAVVTVPFLVALVAGAFAAHPGLRGRSVVVLGLYCASALASGSPALHLALAGLALAAAIATAGATFREASVASGPWRDYVTLTKPRIMSLLLVTGFFAMLAGERGFPPATIVFALVVGLALPCGGASALNHVLDRDIDRLMGKRTADRPVASGRVPASRAFEFGLALIASSFVLLAALANLLAAVLALAGGLFYVLVYTRWLKRSTHQNIVIGGAAGAVPPLVGWAAATGELTATALALFAIVFIWTPPHFWSLALLIKRNYAAAKVPMLPVVRGDRETARQILLYSVGLVAATLAPFALGLFGLVYLVAAAILGAVFLFLARRLHRATTPRHAAALFHYSLLYLALLFGAIGVDAVAAPV